MRNWLARLFLIAVVFQPLGTLAAGPQSENDERGWTFYGRLQGSSNESGLVLRMDPAVGYTFNRYFQTSFGLPVYFVRESSTLLTTSSNPGFVNGIGNAYWNGQFSLLNPAVDYMSNLVITAPTGDKDQGFSTGRVTVDWTNGFSRRFSAVTPFTNIGVANTVSDTAFFVRPFSSYGLVGHFEGGTFVDVHRFASVGASGYAVRASGEQRLISKVTRRTSATSPGTGSRRRPVFEEIYEIVAPADIANDQGFSGWLSFTPVSKLYLQTGFSRSTRYDLNSLFFGIGFRVGK
jgi:hypothetical protein